MMNKKGQVLVVFILLLPLIILFLGLVIDIGNSLVTRKKYENTVKDIILYNYKEEKTEEVEEPNVVTGENIENPDDSSEVNQNESSEENNGEIETNEPEIPIKEVDLEKVKKNIQDSIEEAEEVSLKIEDNILIANVNAHYKSIFGNLFDVGLNSISIEVKYNIETKKIVRE